MKMCMQHNTPYYKCKYAYNLNIRVSGNVKEISDSCCCDKESLFDKTRLTTNKNAYVCMNSNVLIGCAKQW